MTKALMGCESRIQAATARLAARVDSSRVWANDGSRSCAAWLGRAATHPTCDTPSTRCDIDHVIDWDAGGPTDQDNGRPRCPAHHPKRRQ